LYLAYIIEELSCRSKIRHWSKLPVSVRADRWLRAWRHRHLIRVNVTRAVRRHTYDLNDCH